MNYLSHKRTGVLGVTAFLLLLSSVAHAWWNESWKERKPLRIDTSAKGANITDPIGPTPVLVRLHPGNFRFDAAKQDGSDLRFIAGDDQTPLAYHIEKYDSLLGEALIWVGIQDLKPGASTDVWIYFGNNEAANAEDKKGTYDPAAVLVYHFADPDKPAQDSTTWANNAIEPSKNTTETLIGRGLRLDGKDPLTIPPGPALIWAEGGAMTWSVWLRPAKDEGEGVVFSRQKEQNAVVIGLDHGKPYVEVRKGPDSKRVTATKSLKAQSWSHVAVTAGKEIALYVDGTPQGKLEATLPLLDTKAVIGGMATVEPSAAKVEAGQGQKEKEPVAGFEGDLDELEIAKAERSLGFIRTAVAAQGTDPAKFLSFGQDEEKVTGIGSAYFPIIINSVTFDGWVVIGVLGLMSLISWMIMIGKVTAIRAVEKANARFLKSFQELGGDLVHLIGSRETLSRLSKDKTLQNSPLLRIFLIGAEEIRKRTTTKRPLTSENLTVIRTSLDKGLVYENQHLMNRMVLLTIAISGGPFLGLLGTVIGVMITFAGVAAAGDVNVNAIAPGIAAALVATIAGLAVAIPALFGYNWLITRIKVVSSNLHVFVEELIAKAAEAYAERAEKHNLSTPRQFLAEGAIVESDGIFEECDEDLSGGQIASS